MGFFLLRGVIGILTMGSITHHLVGISTYLNTGYHGIQVWCVVAKDNTSWSLVHHLTVPLQGTDGTLCSRVSLVT